MTDRDDAVAQARRTLDAIWTADDALVVELAPEGDEEARLALWEALAWYAVEPGDHRAATRGAADATGWPPARVEALLAPVRSLLARWGASNRERIEAAAAAVGLTVPQLLAADLYRRERELQAAEGVASVQALDRFLSSLSAWEHGLG